MSTEKYGLSNKIPVSLIGTLLLCLMFTIKINAQPNILKEKISLSVKNENIETILNLISKKCHCYFSYDESIVNTTKTCGLKIHNILLDSVLRLIFPDTSLKFKAIEKHIIIYRHKIYDKTQNTSPEKKNIEIHGITIDAETHEKIAFASVGIRGTNLGTVSNIEGVFILKIPEAYQDSIICISNIGYSDVCIEINKMTETPKIIGLKRSYIAIQEIIIRNNEPVSLLKKALERKMENYVSTPTLLTGFYREGIISKNKQISCSEAMVEIYKSPYAAQFPEEQIKILQSRKFIRTQSSDSVMIKLKAGTDATFLLDFMAHDIDFLSGDCFERYNYRMSDMVTYNETSAYVIEFEQKKEYDSPSYKGRIFIESENLGIIGAEFEVDIKNMKKNSGNFVVKKRLNIQPKINSVKYIAAYKKIDDKLMINHVRCDMSLRVKKRKTLFAADFLIYFELVAFDAQTQSVTKFKRNEILKNNIIFIDSQNNYNPDFWGDNNYLSPDELPKQLPEKLIRGNLNYRP